MNKDEKMRAISQLVFELTVATSSTADLDVLLMRLFEILCKHQEFSLQPRGAIVLLNPRGRYFQVAQFGIEPGWKSDYRWKTGAFATTDIAADCIADSIPFPPGNDVDTKEALHRVLLLPLHIENHGVGYAVLFAQADYQPKPVHLEFMSDLARVLSGLVQRALIGETLLIRELELEEARADALRSLGVASEYRDNDTGFHIMRMTNFAQAIAKAMGMSSELRELLYVAAPMHDVGKIGISDAVLLKPGKLTPEEFEIMKTHAQIGATILSGHDSLIAAARDIAGSHHERWDGTGYPAGLAGEAIPILARVCAVADVFDALTSVRPYKQAWTVEDAYDMVMSESGKYFDPAVVCAFDAAMPEILRIRELYRDDIIDPKQVLTLPAIPPREGAWAVWDDSLSVGIDIIDEHHRYLFDLINDLFDVVGNKRGSRQVARLIKSLDSYAKVHFRAEEQMMTHCDYGGLERQLHQHHAFEAKISEFYEEMHINPLVAQFDVLTYLRDWLIHHIKVEDAQLRELSEA